MPASGCRTAAITATPAVRNLFQRVVAGFAFGVFLVVIVFSRGELKELLQAAPGKVRPYLTGRIDVLDRRIAAVREARERISHALTCRHPSLLDCPTFRTGLRDLLPGE